MLQKTGSSLVEVVVMMVILSVAIVGIYTLVNNGQKLARITDDRLVGLNIARAGVEGVAALRDTFHLRAYSLNNCFFTIDGQPTETTCARGTGTQGYILKDDGTLEESTSFDVCINESGWYSQEWIGPGSVNPCSGASLCIQPGEVGCRTLFQRKIMLRNVSVAVAPECSSPGTVDTGKNCTQVVSEVWWGVGPEKKVTLTQLLSRL